MSNGSKEKDQNFKDGIIDFTAGSLGGIALVYVGQPLDTVKVKMQTFPHLYTNMVDCFKKTLQSDGIYRGLYAGSIPALATNVVENSVLFLCYGFCQKVMQNVTGADSVENLSIMSNATAGFLASFFSSLAICPTELIKCKLQAMNEMKNQEMLGKKSESVGPFKLTAQIMKQEGPPFWHGNFTYCFSLLGTRALLTKPGQKKDDLSLLETMFAGAVGGSVFWTLTYPVDVAKSRIQVGNLDENMFKTIFRISRTEGVAALYNGLTPTLIRTVPATATLFATYEYSKRWLHYVFRDY
ncbi:hypothetical protein NQ314_020478 [Rhamnusium bicolor]|uniref:Mitochondrial ornithine transporter 1 n=1 Tax=Rhamnusium bicolor TaxID=1586634 RepID=A0AAV8WLX9_9CUCU|nr:hypothetical protein NQ314_020478 [Rhamnusium bicolor]